LTCKFEQTNRDKKLRYAFKTQMQFLIYNAVYLLKARIADPEKQPLLANASEITFASGQRIPNEQE
jgi:hypothetical protein